MVFLGLFLYFSLLAWIIFLLLHPASEEERTLKNGEKDIEKVDLRS
jgi:large-conductance mechanosensitive channel